MRDLNKKNIIVLCCILGLIFRVVICFFYRGGWRPDEIFQNLEPAHHLLTGHGVVTWEWQAGVRNWVLPGAIAGIWEITRAMGLGLPVVAVKLVFAVLSVSIIVVFATLGGMLYGRAGAWTCGVMAALWPDLLIGADRTAGEFQAGNTMGLAIGLAMIGRQLQLQGRDNLKPYLGCAAFLGLTVVLRFQLAPAVALSMLWVLFWLPTWRDRIAIALTSLLPVLALGIVDGMTWGGFYPSIVNNFYVNIFKSVSKNYGVMPFYYYVESIISFWQFAFLAFVFLFVKGMKRAWMPAVIGTVIIFYHSLIAHKETSFIYAAMPPLVLVASLGLSSILEKLQPKAFAAAIAVVAMCCCMAASPFKQHMNMVSRIPALLYKASRQEDSCGVAVLVGSDEWGDTGGYSQFTKRDIPLYFYYDKADIQNASHQYNYVVSYRTYRLIGDALHAVACKGYYCLYKTAQTCSGAPDYSQFEKMVTRAENQRVSGQDPWLVKP
ncbi:glycosyltransferase family protein [Komagataeibacter europaeus]|nr:hypothetical protein [Komagataeibacter europaeus]